MSQTFPLPEATTEMDGMYLRAACPHCSITCYVYYGDPEDTSLLDPEAMSCWNCKKLSSFIPNDKLASFDINSVEEYEIRASEKSIEKQPINDSRIVMYCISCEKVFTTEINKAYSTPCPYCDSEAIIKHADCVPVDE